MLDYKQGMLPILLTFQRGDRLIHTSDSDV